MTDHQLDQLLKTVQVPTESPDFCEALPKDVLRGLQRSLSRPRETVTLPNWFAGASHPRLAFAGLWAAAAIMLLLALWSHQPGTSPGITDQQLAEARKYYSELAGLFPSQLRGVVLGRNSTTLLLAEQPNVAQEEAVLVQVASPNSRTRVVVLNGQDFSFEGKRYEVLLDHQGGVLVVGPDCAWSSRETRPQPRALQIAARSLNLPS